MSRLGPGAAILFWFMCAGSGVSLGVWLMLPAWLDYQTAREAVEQARVEHLALRQQLRTAERQIEHLLHDRDYQERVAQREFGFERPEVERLIVQPADAPSRAPTLAEATGSGAAGPRPAGSSMDDGAESTLARARGYAEWLALHARRNRFLAIYVLEETRPIVFLISLLTLLAAIVLLNNRWSLPLGGRAPAPPRAEARRPRSA